ncbi:unnamed protein product [Durusdinium trenchii]|uniref:PDZ domain-containing protein n=1 Tax=Durusdinium trenchii TaxID=1381693 RepID=A0ABP0S9V8_9DINO
MEYGLLAISEASRCKEVDNQFLFSSRSSPDLAADLRREGVPEGEGAGQAGFHKDNCGILWHKDTVANQESPQSDVPTCYEACCDARLVFRKLASIFHSALGHGDLGIEDPGFHDPANAVIIFDWDDTLLPTTYILGTIIPSLAEEDRAGVLPESSEYKEQLAAHAHLVSFLLRAARRVARVAIVSNSLSPWVQASAARYLPGVDFEALFEELDLPVYYSRQHLSNIPVTYKVDNWEVNLDRRTGGRIGVDIIREFDGSLAVAKIEEGGLMDQWNQSYPDQAVQPGDRFAEVNGNTESLAAECRKLQELKITVYRAVPDRDPYVEAKRIDMTACLDKFYGRHVKWQQNVLSIGDACTEQQAIKEVLHDNAESSRPQPLCKTVNLIDTPTLEQLSNELRILLVWLSKMVQYPKDFDLFMDELGAQSKGCHDQTLQFACRCCPACRFGMCFRL